MNQTIYPPLSQREIRGAEISKNAAKEGMVLLKNDRQVLPLKPQKIALFGNGAVRTVRGGTGSGDPFNGGISGGGDFFINQSPRYHINVLPALKKAGFEILSEEFLEAQGAAYDDAMKNDISSHMQVFAFPEPLIPEEDIASWSHITDTAIFVLSRNSGEGVDRKLEDDYSLSESEKTNLKLLHMYFHKLILVLNVPGPVAVKDLEEVNPDAILIMGQPGQEAGEAVTEVLTGVTTPSGHLTTTWAREYEDYPSADVFLKEWDESLYTEGIYVGYRYFNTFNKKAGYPFGYGLSYTTFEIGNEEICLKDHSVFVKATVKNTGACSGKEVLQLYVSAPSTELDMPEMELKGYKKTGLLNPGESEDLLIEVPVKDLSSFSEEKTAYILSEGYYIFRLGTSSVNTRPIGALRIFDTAVTKLVYEELPLHKELDVLQGLKGNDRSGEIAGLPVMECLDLPEVEDARSVYQTPCVTTYTTDPDYQAVMPYEKVELLEKKAVTLQDVFSGKASLEELVAQLTDEQLADFACGTGWGVEDDSHPVIGGSSESVPGAAGETTHALEKDFGIPSIVSADGPGGVRLTQHFEAENTETGEMQEVWHHCIAWPVGTLIAQSFDDQVAELVGLGMKEDLKAFNIDLLLGPGINIHRNPLCGRNFEYFSEDPLLAGKMASAITKGVQEGNEAGACIKHYAANNQETNRNANISVVSQRALREIYLEPFRIAVTESQPMTVMTSYNQINGVPAADSRDLCMNLLRGEWGFKGFVMTDWNGGSSTPSISMFAGNDLIMPGGFSRTLNILNAVKSRKPEFDERGEVQKMDNKPFPIYTMLWGTYTPDPEGDIVLTAELGEGHTAEVSDDQILVDKRPIYTEAGTIRELFAGRENFKPFKTPLTTAVASVSSDGKKILYRMKDTFKQSICRGDIQDRAMNILKVIELLKNK